MPTDSQFLDGTSDIQRLAILRAAEAQGTYVSPLSDNCFKNATEDMQRLEILRAIEGISGGGGGTVTNIETGTGLTGGPITTTGTIAVSYGTTAGTSAQGNDSRLSDARTPTAHASTHAAAGSDPITVTLTSQVTGTLPVANGGTGVTISSGANSVVLRDANGNTAINSITQGFVNVVAAGTTTILTVSSAPNYVVTGSGGQTYQLPNATTLNNGTTYLFNNNQSSGTIVVKNNSSTTIATIESGGYVEVLLLSNSTAAGSWDVHNQAPSNVSWSTNTFNYPGSITNATWNGNTVAANRGGTGQSAPFVAGGIAYGSSTSALGVTPIGTAGQVLTSAGAGTPTWTTPTTGTVTSVTGTSPIASTLGATPAISIADAAADGTTKGAAAFNASDFDATAGVVSIDYTNGQAASASTKGFLTSANWTTFNSKQATITTGAVDNAILRADGTGGATLQNSDINIDDATVTTQANVAITNQHSGQTNSALVLTPKGTGALIAGPKPDGTATGGNARGSNAVDLQISRNSATQVASGINSVILGGIRNTSAGTYSFVGGGATCNTSAEGSVICGGENNAILTPGNGSDYSVICGGTSNSILNGARGAFIGAGRTNSASGNCSVVVGGGERSTSLGNSATASSTGILSGRQAIADRFSMQSHSSGAFAALGDAQRARFVLRCKTTTNTGVEMALDGATTYLGIPSGKVISMTINISGVKSDGTAVAHYVRQYAVKNVAGTSSQVYAPVTIGSDNATGTTIALSANDADDTLRILVTGIASETWRWVASVDAVEIAYGT